MPKRSPAFPMEDAPNYNPEDPYADKVALADHKHYMLGQHFIREARARILREKVKECYGTHGVDHFEECKEIREKYMQAANAADISWLDASPYKSNSSDE
eukprot:jgi/Ulvmu1/5986/UM026_0110.1